MTRTSYAMDQFVNELLNLRPEASVVLGGTDGYGTHRSLLLDAKTAEWISPIVRAVNDKRISQRGETVHFSTHPIDGESREPFGLAQVADIIYPPKRKRKRR